LLVHGLTEDGQGLKVIRQREDRLEVGALRPLVEGKPIDGEVVQVRPRPSNPLVLDVDVLYAPRERDREHDAPVDGARRTLPGSAADSTASPGGAAQSGVVVQPRESGARPTSKGPAQVATDRYRDNWELIYRGRKPSLPS
jgi:hypothetical protein